MDLSIEKTWTDALSGEFDEDYYKKLISFVSNEYEQNQIYPPQDKIFAAFDLCPVSKTKVVILGQDPYHGEGQANGLCFSVAPGVKQPPSLVNIFKELKDDLNVDTPESGGLEAWASQGVLMLNATLTVRSKTPGSHQKKGWEQFTDAVINYLNETKEHVVYILWGAYAQKKGTIIDRRKNLVIESVHPSPFSVYRGFYGSKPFSKTNEYLKNKGLKEINWRV